MGEMGIFCRFLKLRIIQDVETIISKGKVHSVLLFQNEFSKSYIFHFYTKAFLSALVAGTKFTFFHVQKSRHLTKRALLVGSGEL